MTDTEDTATPLAPPLDAELDAPQAFVIVIDAGHGGSDTGVSGTGGLLEKDVTLAIAREVNRILSQEPGIRPLMTRIEDVSIPDKARTRFRDMNSAKALVSIHAGASSAPEAQGFEVFSYGGLSTERRAEMLRQGATLQEAPGVIPESRALATQIAESLMDAGAGKNRGVHDAPCRILLGTTAPGCVVEVGCLTNPAEESMLSSAAFQARIGQGIAQGVILFAAGRKAGGAEQ